MGRGQGLGPAGGSGSPAAGIRDEALRGARLVMLTVSAGGIALWVLLGFAGGLFGSWLQGRRRQ